MTTVLVVLHVIISLLLIGVVLIQRGQGAEMGVSFGGGGAQTLFGSRGSGSFLGKLTGGLAAAFMLTSLILAFFSQQHSGSVVERALTTELPAQQLPAEKTPGPASKPEVPAESLPPAE